MIQTHVERSRLPAIVGLPAQVAGMLAKEIEVHWAVTILGILLWLGGTILLYKALSEYALARGRDPALGWLALLSLLGILIVATRPDLSGKSQPSVVSHK